MEFNEIWSQLPHGKDYDPERDWRYWEYRIAYIINGEIAFSNQNRGNLKYDVLYHDKKIEIKTAARKFVTDTSTGFMFSHLRTVTKWKKEADIILLIGICEIHNHHIWIAEYKNLLEILPEQSNALTLSCYYMSGWGRYRDVFLEIKESKIKQWILQH